MDSKGRRKYSQANKKISPRRSCYGTHLWASLLIVFRRVRQYCRIRSHDVGGSAGAMPAARCNACRAMQCIGFQNGRRHADEKFWDHDSTTSEGQTTLQCKQARHSRDEKKIQAQKSCLILQTRFVPNRPYRYGTRTTSSRFILYKYCTVQEYRYSVLY